MKRRIIVLAIALGALLLAATLLLSPREAADVKVAGHWRPEDVPQMLKAIRRGRWAILRRNIAAHEFKTVFKFLIPTFALRHVREIGDLPDRPMTGFAPDDPNPSSHAYVVCGGWRLQTTVVYALERTTNGWKVSSLGFHKVTDRF